MKGLNKIALVAAIAAASSAQAELTALDDSAMGELTGQAGLTIDVNSANIEIGEIQYKDAGSIFISQFKMGGAGIVEVAANAPASLQTSSTTINNLRINIDIAGDGTDVATIGYGLDKVTDAGVISTVEFNAGTLAATGAAALSAAAGYYDSYVTIDDGDLVIGLDAQDQATLVDLGMIIGAVTLGESTAETGSRVDPTAAIAGGSTVLMANTAFAMGLGPVDIVIDGQDGGMNINAHFGMKGQFEFPFVATKFGFRLHNDRGLVSLTADVTTDNGQAYELTGGHANVTIGKYEGNGNPLDGAEGLVFNLNNFEADIDMTDITFGNAPAIGDLYITDMKMSATTVVYGH